MRAGFLSSLLFLPVWAHASAPLDEYLNSRPYLISRDDPIPAQDKINQSGQYPDGSYACTLMYPLTTTNNQDASASCNQYCADVPGASNGFKTTACVGLNWPNGTALTQNVSGLGEVQAGKCYCNIQLADEIIGDIILALPKIVKEVEQAFESITCELLFDAFTTVLQLGADAIPGVGELSVGLQAGIRAAAEISSKVSDAVDVGNSFFNWFQSPCGSNDYTNSVDELFGPLAIGAGKRGLPTGGGRPPKSFKPSDAPKSDPAPAPTAKASDPATKPAASTDSPATTDAPSSAKTTEGTSAATSDKSTASSDKTTASSAKSTGSGTSSAQTTASGDKSTASSDKTTASSAKSTGSGASSAQSTASGDKSTASNAQSTASGDKSTASNAQSTASGDKTTGTPTWTSAKPTATETPSTVEEPTSTPTACVPDDGDDGPDSSASDGSLAGTKRRRLTVMERRAASGKSSNCFSLGDVDESKIKLQNADDIADITNCLDTSGTVTAFEKAAVQAALIRGAAYSKANKIATGNKYPHDFANTPGVDRVGLHDSAGVQEFPILTDGSLLWGGRNVKTDVGPARVLYSLASDGSVQYQGIISHDTPTKVANPNYDATNPKKAPASLLPFADCQQVIRG